MKVNINGVWYDAEETPIQIELSKSDKENIKNMHEDKFNYICFPDNMKYEEVKDILKPSRGCCNECGEGYDNEEDWLYNTECELCGTPIPENLIIKKD